MSVGDRQFGQGAGVKPFRMLSACPRIVRRGLAVVAGGAALAALAVAATAAPKAKLWPRWTAHDAASTATIDHGPWQKFLGRYVVPGSDGVNRVAYSKVTPADRSALDAYIGRLVATAIGAYNRDEQIAFWINLYNALTVRLVLDHYPFPGMLKLNISPGLFSFGPWGRKLIHVDGAELSLDDIEHRILRPIWRDPRIHYAVNCASIGCPNLQTAAYTGGDIERQLTAAARAYINNWRGVRFDGGAMYVSSLYKWYRSDFGGNARGVIAHLRRYAKPALVGRIEAASGIGGYQYDWALNDAAPSS